MPPAESVVLRVFHVEESPAGGPRLGGIAMSFALVPRRDSSAAVTFTEAARMVLSSTMALVVLVTVLPATAGRRVNVAEAAVAVRRALASIPRSRPAWVADRTTAASTSA